MLGIFLDTETNGLNPFKHRAIELAYKVVDLGTGEEKEAFHAIIYQREEDWTLSDPTSLQINGFTWSEVSRGEQSSSVTDRVLASFRSHGIKRGSAVFICQNPSFDRAFFSQIIDPDMQEELNWPYHWLDLASMYWAKAIGAGSSDPKRFPWLTGFSKDKIARVYNLPAEANPHRAMNGVNHLLACYRAAVGFPNFPNIASNVSIS